MTRLVTACACVAPAVAFSHPGHFDHAPMAHSAAHGLEYATALAALLILAKAHGKYFVRTLTSRLRRRR